jgi:Arc/MetJ-type ribon-helix-helix transcriptional regulator
MSEEQVLPIQFQKKMIKEIENYIDSGLYSSKAEFIRDAIRMRIIELRKDLFLSKTNELKQLSKSKGVKVNSFASKEDKEDIAQSFRKKLSA